MIRGIYVLIISIDKNIHVNVGALGELSFEKGLYAYVGSAQRGLERRIERHLRKTKRRFWHIDHLLGNNAVRILGVLGKEADKREECMNCKMLDERGVAMDAFGSSDCGCGSHLFMLQSVELLKGFMHAIAAS